jgi:hypothetical protein
VLELTVAGRAGVPADASAVLLNVTAIGPSADGFVTVFPCGSARPLASSVNHAAGGVAANAVFAKVGAGGTVCIFTQAATDLAVDINGYVYPTSLPVSLVPPSSSSAGASGSVPQSTFGFSPESRVGSGSRRLSLRNRSTSAGVRPASVMLSSSHGNGGRGIMSSSRWREGATSSHQAVSLLWSSSKSISSGYALDGHRQASRCAVRSYKVVPVAACSGTRVLLGSRGSAMARIGSHGPRCPCRHR